MFFLKNLLHLCLTVLTRDLLLSVISLLSKFQAEAVSTTGLTSYRKYLPLLCELKNSNTILYFNFWIQEICSSEEGAYWVLHLRMFLKEASVSGELWNKRTNGVATSIAWLFCVDTCGP